MIGVTEPTARQGHRGQHEVTTGDTPQTIRETVTVSRPIPPGSGTPFTDTHPWYGYASAASGSQQAAALRAAVIALVLLAALALVIWI